MFFIIELVTRNPTIGIPALEDGLFVFKFVDFQSFIVKRERKREGEKGREGKGREKGKNGKR